MASRSEVDIQADTFANWCTYVLHDRQQPPYRFAISDLKYDLRDGAVLSDLLGKLLRSEDYAAPHSQPTCSQDCLDNLAHVIRVCEDSGVFGNEGYASAEAAGIRVDDIFNGRLDGTLSLLYRLISHFDILHVPLLTARQPARERPLPPPSDVILSWVRSFDDVEELQDVMDLTQAWRNGKALYALVARIAGLESRAPPVQHPVRAVTLAMDIAAEQLGVPDILAPTDLCHPSCDNLSVMTYLAQLRNAVETRDFLCNPYLYLHLLAAPIKDAKEEARPISVLPSQSIFDEVFAAVDNLALSPDPDDPKPSPPGDQSKASASQTETNTEETKADSKPIGDKPSATYNAEQRTSEASAPSPASQQTPVINGEEDNSDQSVLVRFPGPPLPPRQRGLGGGDSRDVSALVPSKPPPQYPGRLLNGAAGDAQDKRGSMGSSSSGGGGGGGAHREGREQGTVEGEEAQEQCRTNSGHLRSAMKVSFVDGVTAADTSTDAVPGSSSGDSKAQAKAAESAKPKQPSVSPPHTPSRRQQQQQQQPPQVAGQSPNAEVYHPTMPGQPAFVMRGAKASSNILLAPNVRPRRTSAPVTSLPEQTSYTTPMTMVSRPYKISLSGWYNRAWTVPNHRLPESVSFPCNLIAEKRLPVPAGAYWLVITPPAACLFSRDTHERVAEWPLNHILRYGLDNTSLTLEIGERMNPRFTGLYVFEMSNGHHVSAFDTLQRYTQLWSRRFL